MVSRLFEESDVVVIVRFFGKICEYALLLLVSGWCLSTKAQCIPVGPKQMASLAIHWAVSGHVSDRPQWWANGADTLFFVHWSAMAGMLCASVMVRF